MSPHQPTLRLIPHVLALAGLLVPLAPLAAFAADAHGGAGAEAHAKPAAGSAAMAAPAAPAGAATPAAPASGPTAVASRAEDPLDVVRQRLAERLSARQAAEAGSQNLVKIATRSTGAFNDHAAEPAPARRRAPAAVPAQEPMLETLPAPRTVEGRDVHWAYAGSTGPDTWSQLNPDFMTCAIGRRQSPIDIRDGFKVQLDPVQFDYRSSGFSVIDNGHTVQVNVSGGNSIMVSGRRYELVQFHFHRPSEERINGRAFDMVAHLVHKDPDGRLAVVAVLLDRGSAQPLIQTVWNNLPLERGEEQPGSVSLDLNALLPTDRSYYTYMGSLTTPPCSEGVLWMVMKTPVQISPQQIDIFSRLYPMNARPVQRTAGRTIKESE